MREIWVNNAPLIPGGGDKLGVAITGVPVSVSVPKAAAVGGRTVALRRIDRPAASCSEPVGTGVAFGVWAQGINTDIRDKLLIRVCVTDRQTDSAAQS